MKIKPGSRIIIGDSCKNDVRMMMQLLYGFGQTNSWSQTDIQRFLPIAKTLGIKDLDWPSPPNSQDMDDSGENGPSSPAQSSILGSVGDTAGEAGAKEMEAEEKEMEAEEEEMEAEEEVMAGGGAESVAAAAVPEGSSKQLRVRESKRICPHCRALIPAKSLARHIRTSHDNRAATPLVCDKCQQPFSRPEKLTHHKLVSCRRYLTPTKSFGSVCSHIFSSGARNNNLAPKGQETTFLGPCALTFFPQGQGIITLPLQGQIQMQMLPQI
jgi:hypothetical protein